MSENGTHVTRGELAAHIRRIDEHLASIDARLGSIEKAVAAPRRWASERLTTLLDRALPAVLVAGATYLIVQL